MEKEKLTLRLPKRIAPEAEAFVQAAEPAWQQPVETLEAIPAETLVSVENSATKPLPEKPIAVRKATAERGGRQASAASQAKETAPVAAHNLWDVLRGGAEQRQPAPSDLPWQQEHIRADVNNAQLLLRLPEAHKLKLAYLSERTRLSEVQIIREVLLPEIDRMVEHLLKLDRETVAA